MGSGNNVVDKLTSIYGGMSGGGNSTKKQGQNSQNANMDFTSSTIR